MNSFQCQFLKDSYNEQQIILSKLAMNVRMLLNLVFLYLCVGLTASLHLKMHLTVSNYVALLKQSYVKIGTILDDLQASTSSSINAQGSIDQKITTTDELLAKELQSFASLETLLIKPINQSEWVCNNIQDAQLTQLNSQIGILSSQQEAIRSSVENLTDTNQNQELIQTLDNINKQIDATQKAIYAAGRNPFIQNAETTYRTNLLNQNWIIGNQTMEQLSTSYGFNNEKITLICEEETPYFFDGSCQSCDQQPQVYFDFVKNKCVACKNFDANSHKCSDTYGSNLQSAKNRYIIPLNSQLTDFAKDIQCPEDKPFYSNNQCIDCTDQNNLFSLETFKCTKCAQNQIYNETSHLCDRQIRYFTNLSPSVQQLIILPANSTFEEVTKELEQLKQSYNVIQCNTDKPFKAGENCINCQEGTYFDYSSKECRACKQNQIYNQTSHSCDRQIRYFTNLSPSVQQLIILPVNSTFENVQKEYQSLKQSYNVIQCNTDKPFKAGENCINCQDGTYFDYSSKDCRACEQNEFYNKETSHCDHFHYFTDLSSPNWKSATKTEQQIIKANKEQSSQPNSKICSKENAFFNGEECIACDSSQQFDVQALICSSCGQKQYYSATTHRCLEIAEVKSQTNPDVASNLIYAKKSYNYWMKVYYSNLVDDELLPDCPKQSPYWSVQSCISCPESRPYFNMDTQQCQICPSGAEYNNEQKECMTGDGTIQN